MAARCNRAAAVLARSRCSTGPTSNGRRSGRRRSEYGDVRALLTFNCAPDRLGWLSVDADECPPHVFGVTEADRLRDAFDRFGSRLYAASSQIDGEPFGDVIASIANGSGNTVILWRQIDGGCELRLSAMAAMVDDEVLCHAFGDGKTMVLLDQSQREIDPGRDARRSPYVAVPTEDAICLNPDGWVLSLKARCISPVRRRSTPVQQSSRREGECTGADAHNAPASARCLHNMAQRASG